MSTHHTLSDYLRVIFRLQDEPALQSHRTSAATQSHDAGYTIENSHTEYHFTNGVHIVCEVEQEWETSPTKVDNVCPPSDITYRVVQAAGHSIEPVQKSFKNSCQMLFWIQAHHASAATHKD